MKISAKKYIDNQVQWAEKVKEAELFGIQKAVQEFKEVYIQDKGQANEFRGQLKDQTGTFVTRRELWGAVVAIIGIVASIMAMILTYAK